MKAALIAVVHLWIGAVWLGGVWLSLVNLHRRGPALFADEAEFERVIAGFTRGNRWLLLGASGAMVGSGGLLWWLIDAPSPAWSALVWAKVALLIGNVVAFSYVSWIIWPRRLFALAAELPAIRRRQTRLRVVSVLCLAASAALGVVAHSLRSGA